MNPLPHRAAWQKLIARKLDELGWTMYRLSKEADVSRPTVSAWMKATAAPSPEHQARLIRLLEITPDELHAVYATAEEAAS